MREQEKQSLKETRRKEKRIEEEVGRPAKEWGRKQAHLAREETRSITLQNEEMI